MNNKIGLYNLIFILIISALPSCGPSQDLTNPTQTPIVTIASEDPDISDLETPSPTKEVRSTPTPTEAVTKFLEYPLIGIVPQDHNSVYLHSLHNDKVVELIPFEINNIHYFAWSRQGCEIIVRGFLENDEEDKLYRIDLNGNILELFYDIGRHEIEGVFSRVNISPDERFIAFTLGVGEYIDRDNYAIQNIFIAEVSHDEELLQLTYNGGVRLTSWSPTGEYIAYTGIDSDGIQQLYVSKPDGSSMSQITRNIDNNITFSSIHWSPDETKIAFRMYAPEVIGYIYSITVISLDEKFFELSKFDQLYDVEKPWWQDSSTLVVYAVRKDSPSYSKEYWELIWVDVNSGKTIRRYAASESPDGYMMGLGPIGSSSLVGFRTIYGFYAYDFITEKVAFVGSRFVDINSWEAAPSDFPGEEGCLQ